MSCFLSICLIPAQKSALQYDSEEERRCVQGTCLVRLSANVTMYLNNLECSEADEPSLQSSLLANYAMRTGSYLLLCAFRLSSE